MLDEFLRDLGYMPINSRLVFVLTHFLRFNRSFLTLGDNFYFKSLIVIKLTFLKNIKVELWTFN